jgi:hypothetical protein
MRKNGAAQLRVGYYLIGIRATLGKEAELRVNNIQLEVALHSGH